MRNRTERLFNEWLFSDAKEFWCFHISCNATSMTVLRLKCNISWSDLLCLGLLRICQGSEENRRRNVLYKFVAILRPLIPNYLPSIETCVYEPNVVKSGL